ncbi:GIGA6-like protein [Mya arenaria]|uniref:GIGA6-like protein n=1 Tax=Mya arenaria TaxID=6604 RepID=A0ABY7F7I1_MYAAR|nr:GIGA6-like protein [Mya arenaria]
MTSTTFMSTANFDDLDIAEGYEDYFGDSYPVKVSFSKHWAELCGSGCILTNANDMAKWVKFWEKRQQPECD